MPEHMQMPQQHRRGFGVSPKALLVAIIAVILFAVATQFTFEDLGGGPKSAYQKAPGVNFSKNEKGCPAAAVITVTHVPSGIVGVIEVHQYTVTEEGSLVAVMAGNCLDYRASGLYNTWEVKPK
jgi:hypothetical protein